MPVAYVHSPARPYTRKKFDPYGVKADFRENTPYLSEIRH